MSRLVVVSNRIAPPDEHAASAGGLAVGILGALKAAGGLWFGWSGETGNEDQPLKKVKRVTLRGPLLTSANRTLTNTTTNSPMPFSGLLFIIASIWCNFSVLPGTAIYA
ncbi:trehalose-6-phosphate synthase [Escherichia coli]|uniref:Trehalose-6-phosphate synthase n=1 Tax=Escherichia coli TaxID=562 RepID=A0A376Y760_ECOLX|nr:trehalose-6-phosphate synthase [Escherichia coli]